MTTRGDRDESAHAVETARADDSKPAAPIGLDRAQHSPPQRLPPPANPNVEVVANGRSSFPTPPKAEVASKDLRKTLPPEPDKTRFSGAAETDGRAKAGAPAEDAELSAQQTAKLQSPKNPLPITQQLERCRTAAIKGDCAAARVIAQQIAKQSASFYRDRVANDAVLAKCLANE
jgi:hypothetical protein